MERDMTLAQDIPDLAIEYQCVLPVNERVPIVFSYQPNRKHLIFANRNHFDAPEQFLKAELTRNTSGLLNFIGSLLIVEQMQDELPHIKSVIGQAAMAMDSDLDEWLRWFYCLVDTRALFSPARILIDPMHPERYYYDYYDAWYFAGLAFASCVQLCPCCRRPAPAQRSQWTYDKKPATFGNGTMISLAAKSRRVVDELHAAALASGGTDDGKPGPRPADGSNYVAYVRDPDGNKICAYCEKAK
jgi:hypothetical protein